MGGRRGREMDGRREGEGDGWEEAGKSETNERDRGGEREHRARAKE